MKSNKMLPQYSNKQNKNHYKLLNNGVGHMGKHMKNYINYTILHCHKKTLI